ncbi:hypothetical protein [Sphingobium sp.]|uniref:hypothetical protein n=1 Tax=Sphingobium sp. TaxID=1912891 RepID=UPI002E242CFE
MQISEPSIAELAGRCGIRHHLLLDSRLAAAILRPPQIFGADEMPVEAWHHAKELREPHQRGP